MLIFINKIIIFCYDIYEIILTFFNSYTFKEINNNKFNDIIFININNNNNYSSFQLNYLLLLLFFCCALFFSLLLFFINYILVKKNKYYDKALPYECGFDVIGSPRVSFNIQFYIVAILFLIFDVELVITYPWLVSLKYVTFSGNLIICFFFLILLLSYFYESFNNCFNFKNFLFYTKN